jgi:hypothetical protein
MIWDSLFNRGDAYAPYMPEVDGTAHPDSVFIDARNVGLGLKRPPGAGAYERYIALVTPGRLVVQLACPKPGSRPPSVTVDIRQRFPVEPPGIVVAIAMNDLRLVREIKGAKRAIPFLDYLLNLGYAGHAVTIFEGHHSGLQSALRGADLLIVDGGMIPFLRNGWQDTARDVMRRPIIEILHRDKRVETFDLTAVR